MRVFRLQRTLWRVVVVATLDLAVLCMAALFSLGGAESAGPSAAYAVRTALDNQSQVIPVTITIEDDSSVYLDGIPTEIDGLVGQLEDALRISGGGNVTIESSPGVPFQVVSQAMAAAREAGATSLSFLARRPEGGG